MDSLAPNPFSQEQRQFFRILGEKHVRRRLSGSMWDDEDKAAARQWLEERAVERGRPHAGVWAVGTVAAAALVLMVVTVRHLISTLP